MNGFCRSLSSWLYAPLLLAGCASVPAVPPLADPPIANSRGDTVSWVDQLGAAPTDLLIDVPVNSDLPQTALRAGPMYSAASGRQCRQLENTEGVLIGRVICRADDRTWRLTPSIDTRRQAAHSPSL